jgi:ferric-dicitrate binding protein FerR (iron transport regulator)
MNRQNQIDRLLQKLADNSLNRAELDELMDIINDSDSTMAINTKLHDLWEQQKKTNRSNNHSANYNSDALYHKILDRTEHVDHTKKTKKSTLTDPYKKWLGIAATLILMVGLSLVYIERSAPLPQPTVLPIETNLNSDVITLQLDNGTVETISESGERTITTQQGTVVGSQQGGALNYSGTNIRNTLVYNTLNVPHGKRFDLILSDGTKVKLNSGSSMRYPVQFLPGNNRKVFLRGEAYFDVAKDTEHPFIVNANDLEVQVLGTQFNLSYYPEDLEITTVLVEGSVELYKDGADRNTNTVTQLRPGQKAAWRGADNKMSVNQVDTEIYTAWREGYLLFKATPFSKIKTKLERHFNITIEDRDKHMEKEVYTATFREETIEEILEAFKEDISFSYTRVDNKIIITNSKTN